MSRCRCVAYSDQHQCWAKINYFLVLVLKIYMYYVFHMYMYYVKTPVVFGFTLIRRCIEKVFKPAQYVFKVIIHKLFFQILETSLYYFYILTRFSSYRYFELVGFMFYLIHSLSTWFTHSLISPIFK